MKTNKEARAEFMALVLDLNLFHDQSMQLMDKFDHCITLAEWWETERIKEKFSGLMKKHGMPVGGE